MIHAVLPECPLKIKFTGSLAGKGDISLENGTSHCFGLASHLD